MKTVQLRDYSVFLYGKTLPHDYWDIWYLSRKRITIFASVSEDEIIYFS